jgi:hypothetical protein
MSASRTKHGGLLPGLSTSPPSVTVFKAFVEFAPVHNLLQVMALAYTIADDIHVGAPFASGRFRVYRHLLGM